MRSKILGALVLTMSLPAAQVLADPPFGSFGGIAGGGNSGGGLLPLHGWALDDDGVEAVDIFVDGVIAGRAEYGKHRAGVAAKFPTFPDAQAAGFAFILDTTRFLNGLHSVTARVTSQTGERVFLNERILEFLNTTHNLVPFGRIEFPNVNAELFGNCSLADPKRRFSVIAGHVLDAGIEIGDHGVAWVELLIDGSIWANTRTDCHFSSAKGGLSDCYGLQRLDIARIFPTLRDAPHSGFRFVLDVGFLLNIGYTPGQHVLTIRAGDIAGQVANVAEMAVTFFCDDFVGNQGSFGFIDGARRPGQILSGVVEFAGWALDWEGVDEILVFIDGIRRGTAIHGIPRPDVTLLFPGFPDSDGPGWSFVFDTNQISDGEHHMQVLVRDSLGAVTMIGERRFVVQNVVD